MSIRARRSRDCQNVSDENNLLHIEIKKLKQKLKAVTMERNEWRAASQINLETIGGRQKEVERLRKQLESERCSNQFYKIAKKILKSRQDGCIGTVSQASNDVLDELRDLVNDVDKKKS